MQVYEDSAVRKFACIVINILIAIFAMLFLLSLLYFMHGSFEVSPSEDRQAQIREAAAFLMFIFGILSTASVGIRMKLSKK